MDLFDDVPRGNERLGPGAVLLHQFANDDTVAIFAALQDVVREAPFRHMRTPGGWRMSVAMTNCGARGWITDRTGYRYDAIDPDTARPWPAMPAVFRDVARQAAGAAGFGEFETDACLINRYAPGVRLSLHQDRNERDFDAPIVSVSLGIPATFLWGGMSRAEKPCRLRLAHGDIVVWGGPDRMAFHGVEPLPAADHPETGSYRYNLTFRKAG